MLISGRKKYRIVFTLNLRNGLPEPVPSIVNSIRASEPSLPSSPLRAAENMVVRSQELHSLSTVCLVGTVATYGYGILNFSTQWVNGVCYSQS